MEWCGDEDRQEDGERQAVRGRQTGRKRKIDRREEINRRVNKEHEMVFVKDRRERNMLKRGYLL